MKNPLNCQNHFEQFEALSLNMAHVKKEVDRVVEWRHKHKRMQTIKLNLKLRMRVCKGFQ